MWNGIDYSHPLFSWHFSLLFAMIYIELFRTFRLYTIATKRLYSERLMKRLELCSHSTGFLHILNFISHVYKVMPTSNRYRSMTGKCNILEAAHWSFLLDLPFDIEIPFLSSSIFIKIQKNALYRYKSRWIITSRISLLQFAWQKTTADWGNARQNFT